jgi:hypothetical protein
MGDLQDEQMNCLSQLTSSCNTFGSAKLIIKEKASGKGSPHEQTHFCFSNVRGSSEIQTEIYMVKKKSLNPNPRPSSLTTNQTKSTLLSPSLMCMSIMLAPEDSAEASQ